MNKLFLAALALLCALLPASLYAKPKARLYDLKSGEVFTGEYSKGIFDRSHGKIKFDVRGKKMEGEYSIVDRGSAGWGSVYGSVYSGYRSASVSSFGSFRGVSIDRQGTAVIVGDGEVLDCEFLANGMSGHGSGACKDKAGNLYKLMF